MPAYNAFVHVVARVRKESHLPQQAFNIKTGIREISINLPPNSYFVALTHYVYNCKLSTILLLKNVPDRPLSSFAKHLRVVDPIRLFFHQPLTLIHDLIFLSTSDRCRLYFSRDLRMIVSRLPCRFPNGGNVLPANEFVSWPSDRSFA